jgi:hypothetical protein
MSEIFFSINFIKDLKKSVKKHKHICKDLDRFIKVLLIGEINRDLVRISNLGEKYSDVKAYKIKKFRCSDMPGSGCRSGYRIILFMFNDDYFFTEIYYHESEEDSHNVPLLRSLIDLCFDGTQDQYFFEFTCECSEDMIDRLKDD